MKTVAMRVVYCAHCMAEKSVPGGRAPYGWLLLSVQVPQWFNALTEKNYRWAGVFCSAACLAAHRPELERQGALLDGVYEVGG